MVDTKDLKARAEAVFGGAPAAPAVSTLERDADAAHAKIERLKALREAREKAETERAESARDKARRRRAQD